MAKPFDLESMTESERIFLTKDVPFRTMLIDHEDLKTRVSLGRSVYGGISPKSSTINMGQLDRYLPTELLFKIFHLLPVKALICLAQTNSRTRSVIGDWEPWANLKRYGTNIIRALLATKTDTRWTVSQLELVVFSRDCEFCGELGEVVYLPTLVRCCIKCLASDRRLLTLEFQNSELLIEYTKGGNLTLPLFRSIPQSRIFGCNLPEIFCVNYIEALEFKKATGVTIFQHYDTATPKFSGPFTTADPRCVLDPEYRSIQRSSKSIQHKRQKISETKLPTLTLLTEIIDIPESSTLQFVCSVYQQPVKTVKIRPGSHQVTHICLSGKYCAGCAYFWNYHSPLPFQYHVRYLYRGPGDLQGALFKHISTCIYARMYWNKLYPQSIPTTPSRAIMILEHARQNTIHFPRHSHMSPHSNLKAFEQIPFICKRIYYENLARKRMFQPQLIWEVQENDEDAERGDGPEYTTAKRRSHRLLLRYDAQFRSCQSSRLGLRDYEEPSQSLQRSYAVVVRPKES